MAKIKRNPLIQGIRGSVGDLVFRQMPDDSTYVSKKHDFSKRKFSRGQKEHQSRFQQGVLYAREAAKKQPIYAELARGTIMSPYNWALSDWFNPPVVHKIERTEAGILIWASDNVMVTRVRVTILDGEGNALEKGEGVKGEGIGGGMFRMQRERWLRRRGIWREMWEERMRDEG